MKSREKGVQPVDRALEVLCCFSAQRPEWGVTELAGFLAMGKSAVC